MIVSKPFTELPDAIEPAQRAMETVLAEAGATLPARDAVDLRIVERVRQRKGRVIERETDLPEKERWPDYRSLAAPADADGDGLPDFWEKQFGLDPTDAHDAASLSQDGYANIEQYFNNKPPHLAATDRPIVMVAATGSRAISRKQSGEWSVTRSGDITRPLTVTYTISGDQVTGRDFAPLTGKVSMPAGAQSARIPLEVLSSACSDRTVVISLATGNREFFVGCPSQSLVVIEK
jgi:hypothetical protein